VVVIKSIMLSRWPYFHNGVAAGLRLSASSAEDIDSSWIMFNKQNAGDNRDKVNLAKEIVHIFFICFISFKAIFNFPNETFW
jgi:hypothetical protein